ncbi:MAG: protein translocase subunit SecF [Treponema sp.]|jgi:preprotein translocase subunit SecF|nr:protein translocase subunit SecF [Treponema sp.]
MRIVRFSKLFLPAAILSTAVIAAGLVAYFLNGFNLGVDFQAGLIQEVQFAPTAISLTYSGRGNASISMDRNGLYIVISGSGVEATTHSFPFANYASIGDLSAALARIEGLEAVNSAGSEVAARRLVQSAQGNPLLGADPYMAHYLPDNLPEIPIEEVRSALSALGTASVQVLGDPADRHFMIRLEDSEIDGGRGVPAEKIIDSLEEVFGEGGVAVTRSDYVGSRFSKQLSDQAGLLMALTLLLILIYASIRFKPQFAIAAVLAIAHDAFVIVAFVTWTRMEFNTTTIAAILTILGYSINDTIVIFDRIRENQRIYPDEKPVNILDRSLTETLSRTIITTMTTMLAVLSLYIFTTGSMKDFALCLLVGMISGVYSTVFIASGFVNFWNIQAAKRSGKKLPLAAPLAAKSSVQQ